VGAGGAEFSKSDAGAASRCAGLQKESHGMANTGEFNVYCSGPLSISLHRTGLLGFLRRPEPARCLALSVSDLRMETNARFEEGDRLVLDLGVHDLRVEELHGRVRRVLAVPQQNGYQVDVELSSHCARNVVHCLRHLSLRVNGDAEGTRA
jgi:hypothetical protein